jgi:RNA polymerase sigma-70 factor, ECF subfamily
MDRSEFEAAVARHRAELHAHCYRMLGSVHDADDALQDALLGAWKGLAGFAGKSSLRAWLYRIATHACLQLIARRPQRRMPPELRPPAAPDAAVAAIEMDVPWLEPYPEDPAASYEQRESVELAFIAALQQLPGTQRAVLILCEVLGFAAAEVAEMLGTTPASVNSALERARARLATGMPARSQQATLRELGEADQRALVAAFVEAWARRDAGAIAAMLARDARFTMPPIPSWFDGRDAVAEFFARQVFATAWHLVPMRASGQLAFACYQGPAFRLGALNVISLAGREITELTGFLDPAVHARFGIPTDEFRPADHSHRHEEDLPG